MFFSSINKINIQCSDNVVEYNTDNNIGNFTNTQIHGRNSYNLGVDMAALHLVNYYIICTAFLPPCSSVRVLLCSIHSGLRRYTVCLLRDHGYFYIADQQLVNREVILLISTGIACG